jgi:hypothetical protein
MKLKEKKFKKIKEPSVGSFPVPRGHILKAYAFKHDLLPKNPKTRKVLMKYLEGKDADRYKIEYE